jgi:hypothetical protein
MLRRTTREREYVEKDNSSKRIMLANNVEKDNNS